MGSELRNGIGQWERTGVWKLVIKQAAAGSIHLTQREKQRQRQREEQNTSLTVTNWSRDTEDSAVAPLSKAMLCSRHLPMLNPQGLIWIHICLCCNVCTS